MKRKYNFFINDCFDNSQEILIDTVSFSNNTEAIEYMRANGYNRVEYA